MARKASFASASQGVNGEFTETIKSRDLVDRPDHNI